MNVAIVEDEASVARRLVRSVRSILGEDTAEIAVFASLPEAIEGLGTRAHDVVFLDLNLNGQDGFELLGHAAASRFHTIVVSAHEDQAIHAFEYGVVDFVPKPWTEERLRRAIDRALGRARDAHEPGRAARLAVRHGGRIELIPLGQVRAIRGADDYAELHLEDGSRRLHEKTLADLERILPSDFLRVHRSWIVRVDGVRSFTSAEGGRGTLDLGDMSVPVGRTFRRAVVDRLKSC